MTSKLSIYLHQKPTTFAAWVITVSMGCLYIAGTLIDMTIKAGGF